ncbi:MAG: NADP-dependent malic enzyme [Alphaproteobacteria bacterium]
MTDSFKEMALEYHRYPVPGKLRIEPTKRMVNQRDLALAYSPGVAEACKAIIGDPQEAAHLTARSNLVAVITNGTAVLGLGAIGPLAAKPVMEGKAALFKKFAGIDVFDIEVNERDPERLAAIISSLEPTFGGINLEDIKAPECFEVERMCRERMSIPVFHDDQHGTAICVAAAVANGLELARKDIRKVKIVCAGAGAAALACLDLLVSMGARRERITVCDLHGVVHEGREIEMDPYKARYAQATEARRLEEVLPGADIFLGLSAPGILEPEWIRKMAKAPLILALANPDPEIMPDAAREARPDAILATGRSDFPNQVNNVLCFPFLFRGALDVGATAVNEDMKLAAVRAIAALARAEPSDVVARAYRGERLRFGPDYILPKPFDPRLISAVAPAVARAATESGVARRPFDDPDAYRRGLSVYVYKSGQVMQPVFETARRTPKRVVFAEGEDARVLRAVQIALDDGLALPVLLGREAVIRRQIADLGLRFDPGSDVPFIDPENNPAYEEHCRCYYDIVKRKGISPDTAELFIRTRTTVLGSVLLQAGEADALLCGVKEPFPEHLGHLTDIIGLAPGVDVPSALRLVVLKDRYLFICDTNVNYDPTAEQLAGITFLAANEVRRFGLKPKVALIANQNFGGSRDPSALKMRRVRDLLEERLADFEFDGEMRADAAMIPEIRERYMTGSSLEGAANLLVMSNLEAANSAYNLVWSAADGMNVGPILLGMAKPAHVLSNSVTVRGIVNMTALAVADAQDAALAGRREGREA